MRAARQKPTTGEPRQAAIDPTPEDCGGLAAALRVMAASERAQADRVQGPSFKGSQWGADLIEAHNVRAAVLAEAAEVLVWPGRGLTDVQIKHMVDRFLSWRLPENFCPDAGISFKAAFNEHTPWPMKHEPTGTNLFGADQATEMVRHMLKGLYGNAEAPGSGQGPREATPDAELSPGRNK